MAKLAVALISGVLAVTFVVLEVSREDPSAEPNLVQADLTADGGPSGSIKCPAASFTVGKQQTTIDFSLSCEGTGAKGANRVFVSRFSYSRPGAPSDFLAVSRSGSLIGQTPGGCQLRRGTVSCSAPRGAELSLRGELRVKAGSECSRAVSAYVVLPSSCGEQSACNLEFDTESLFRGRPKGCGSQ
jgi:hypothetical protein